MSIKRIGAVLSAAALLAGVISMAPAQGSSLVFDRGLPTANLNNAAGSNRSNVAWGDNNPVFYGDDFTLTGAPSFRIDTIRIWSVTGTAGSGTLGDNFSSVTLYGGPAAPGNGSLTELMTGTLSPGSNVDSNLNITHTPVTYSGGANYEGGSGHQYQLYQTDFNNLNLTVNGGQLYQFGVNGISTGAPNTNVWFNHASNAALSGSTQQGADGLVRGFDTTQLSSGNINGFDSYPAYWDKSSDVNVQIWATPTPEPMSMMLAGLGLSAVAGLRRKARRA